MALAGFLLLLFVSSFVLYGSFNMMGLAKTAGDDTDAARRGDTIMINLSQMRSQFPEPSDIFAIAGTDGNDDSVTRLIELMNSHGLPFYAQNILMPAARQKGYDDLESMDPDNTSSGSVGDWLQLSLAEIVKAGHRATVNEKNMNVLLA